VDLDELELRPSPVPVRVVPLTKRRTSAPLSIEGRFAASRAVVLKAPASGVITGLDLQLGDPVRQGDVVAAIGEAMLRQRALASEAAVHGLEAALAEREEVLAQAEQRGEPPERLASFEAKRRAAEHKLAQEKVQSKRHALLLEQATVVAPFSGRASSVSVAGGATVVTGNPLLELVEVDPLVLVLDVPTWVARVLKTGDAIQVESPSIEGARRGVVSRWSPTSADDTRRILVEVDNPDGRLAAGERATAILDVGERDAWFAPRAALHHEKKATQLQLVEHSKVRVCKVRVVGGDDVQVEVAGRLEASQLVVLHAERPLSEDAEVVIRGDH